MRGIQSYVIQADHSKNYPLFIKLFQEVVCWKFAQHMKKQYNNTCAGLDKYKADKSLLKCVSEKLLPCFWSFRLSPCFPNKAVLEYYSYSGCCSVAVVLKALWYSFWVVFGLFSLREVSLLKVRLKMTSVSQDLTPVECSSLSWQVPGCELTKPKTFQSYKKKP